MWNYCIYVCALCVVYVGLLCFVRRVCGIIACMCVFYASCMCGIIVCMCVFCASRVCVDLLYACFVRRMCMGGFMYVYVCFVRRRIYVCVCFVRRVC